MTQCDKILILILLAASIVATVGCFWVHRITVRLAFQNEYYRILLADFAKGHLSAEYMTKLSREALWQIKDDPNDRKTNQHN